MKITCKFVELHGPLFLAGSNLGSKLDISKRHGMTLVYDRAYQELHVTYNDHLAVVPSSNIVSFWPSEPIEEKKEEPKKQGK